MEISSKKCVKLRVGEGTEQKQSISKIQMRMLCFKLGKFFGNGIISRSVF